MAFSRDDDGRVSQRPFGGLSFPRTTYAGAETGHQLLHTMYEQLVKRGIEVYDEWYVMDLAVSDEERPADRDCHGVVGYDIQTGEISGFQARDGVILATGGLGQVYNHTTNAVANTGDGVAMAYRAGVPIEDMEFIQFHPTTLPSTGVLITEGVRGEGGILYNSEGERFMFESGYANNDGELASRDVVSRAELTEVNEGRGIEDEYVHLDMRHLGEDRIVDRLENIVHLSKDFEGVDPLEEPMPVKPGQHYAMGGIETNEHGDLGEAEIETGQRGDYELGEVDPGVDVGAVHPAGDAVADGGVAASAGSAGPDDLVRREVEHQQARVDRLMSREDGISHSAVRDEIQETMTANVNVFREEGGLKEALADIHEAREAYRDVAVSDPSRTFNTDLIHTIETRNIIDLAEAITLGALARDEFRGAHWRKEHQERKDGSWLKHTLLSWNDGEPELWYRPVVLDGESKEYEPKVRSY